MPKWNCYTKANDFAGVVEAETENEATFKGIAEFDVFIARVELRSNLDESERHGKG